MTEETAWTVCKVKRVALKFSVAVSSSELFRHSLRRSSLCVRLILAHLRCAIASLNFVSLDYMCTRAGYTAKERDNAICSLLLAVRVCELNWAGVRAFACMNVELNRAIRTCDSGSVFWVCRMISKVDQKKVYFTSILVFGLFKSALDTSAGTYANHFLNWL